MKIVSREIDMAGKYRVLVSIDETEAIELKFDRELKDEEILAEAERVMAARTTSDIPITDDLAMREAALDAREADLNKREEALVTAELALSVLLEDNKIK